VLTDDFIVGTKVTRENVTDGQGAIIIHQIIKLCGSRHQVIQSQGRLYVHIVSAIAKDNAIVLS